MLLLLILAALIHANSIAFDANRLYEIQLSTTALGCSNKSIITLEREDFHPGICSYTYEESYYSPEAIIRRSVRGTHVRSDNETRYVHSDVNKHRIGRVLKKIRDSNEDVYIHVLGGSFTAGRLNGEYAGAWPKKLHDLFRIFGPSKSQSQQDTVTQRVVIENHAVGATTSAWVLASLPEILPLDMRCDLVIIDYDINDAAATETSAHDRNNLLSTTEVLISSILKHPAQPAVAYLHTCVSSKGSGHLTPFCHRYNKEYCFHDFRSPLLRTYSVPVVNTRDAIWETFQCYPPAYLWPCGHMCAHPHNPAHVLTADLVFGFLTTLSFSHNISLYLNASNFNFPSSSVWNLSAVTSKLHEISHPYSHSHLHSRQLDIPYLHPGSTDVNYTMCHTFLSSYGRDYNQSKNDGQAVFRSNSSCWEYYEDVKGKPGYIALDCFGDSIYFVVKFGAVPKLIFAVMQSYTPEFGRVEVSICRIVNGTNNSASSKNTSNVESGRNPHEECINSELYNILGMLDGLNLVKGPVSQAKIFPYGVGCPKTMHSTGWAKPSILAPYEEYSLKITLVTNEPERSVPRTGRKFKIMSLSSC